MFKYQRVGIEVPCKFDHRSWMKNEEAWFALENLENGFCWFHFDLGRLGLFTRGSHEKASTQIAMKSCHCPGHNSYQVGLTLAQ